MTKATRRTEVHTVETKPLSTQPHTASASVNGSGPDAYRYAMTVADSNGAMADRPWCIYTLSDPRSFTVRYVGWTFNVSRRLGAHVNKSKTQSTHKANWINSLVAIGLLPVIRVVHVGVGDWQLAERQWIATYRATGTDLTNATDGGEGRSPHVASAETKAKMSAAHKGQRRSAESIAKTVAGLRGIKRTPEQLARYSACRLGKPLGKRTKPSANWGQKHTEEHVTNHVASYVASVQRRRERIAAERTANQLSLFGK